MISEESLKQALVEEMKNLQSPVDIDKVNRETRFKEDLDLDSLDMMEIMLGLEDQLKIEPLDETEFKGCKTFGDAASVILK